MNAFIAILKKELRSVAEERTIMIAVAIQLFIASFASVLVVGLVAFYDPGSMAQNARITIRAGLVGDSDGTLASFLRQARVRVIHLGSVQGARTAVEDGLVHAAVVIPGPLPRGDEGAPVEGLLLLPRSESLSTVALMVLNPPLRDYENYLRQEAGIEVRYASPQGRPSTTYEFRYTVIVPLLMLFPAFVAGSMVVDSLTEEFESGAMETLRSAPVSLGTILGAKIVAGLILTVAQCSLWLLLLRLNRTRVAQPWLILLLATILATAVSVGAGAIAVALQERERSQFVYSMAIPLLTGLAYLVGLSPTTAFARLATGDARIGLASILLYGVPALALLGALLVQTERWVGA